MRWFQLEAVMCGRVKLEGDFSEIKIRFGIPPEYPSPNTYEPSWNVAPTDSLPIVRYNEKTGSRTLDMMRWGLVPYWAKDVKIGFSTINAMAETVESKPVFREAFRRRRCLVPVEAFYEWKQVGPKDKQPYALGLTGGGLMALAGLWENWKSPAEEWVRSFTIITTTPNEMCAEIHDRMPVILPDEAWPVWLGEKTADSERLKGLLAPYPAEGMTMWPVSLRVGNVKNNDPSLIEPVAPN
jgi:putative SOS response-associated peptidase YedK